MYRVQNGQARASSEIIAPGSRFHIAHGLHKNFQKTDLTVGSACMKKARGRVFGHLTRFSDDAVPYFKQESKAFVRLNVVLPI